MASPTNTKRNFTDDEEDCELRRGPWTLEEDTLLIHYIACHGEGRWDMLAKCSGLKRTGKSCRLRWLNYLKPDVKRGNLSLEEQIIILELHSKWGNRWSRIAQHLPGRTDNEIKNYWRTRVQKQARQLKIDANSKKFQETIRSFWMPRLLQKIEESSHSSSSSSSSTSTSYDSQNMKSQTSPTPLLVNQSPGAPEATKEPIGYYNIEQESNPNIISQFSEISGYPVSPNAFGSNFYSMEAFNMDQQMSVIESSISDCPSIEDSHWMNHEVSLWNMDELWQFRKVQEKGI